MDLRDLKLFLHLAESRHFGRTARAMHVSPSTLSRQIQRLEEDLGQSLFLRDNRTVTLTEAGEQLRQFAQQTLLQYQQLRHAIDQHGPSLSGELKLFCSVTAAYSHLPPILDRFRAEHPQVEIKLTTGDAADAVDKVQTGEAELAIAGRPEMLPASIGFTPLGYIPLVLIAPALPCPVRQQATQPDPDWAQIPFILPEQGPARRRIDLWFRRRRIANPPPFPVMKPLFLWWRWAVVSLCCLRWYWKTARIRCATGFWCWKMLTPSRPLNWASAYRKSGSASR